MNTAGNVLVALVIFVGLVGIVLPLLPGLLLVYAAIAVWAVVEHDAVSWVTLGLVTAVIAATTTVKYLWPARRMRAAEVPTATLIVGAVVGIVGFFVIPVVGLLIGFIGGVFVAELTRCRDYRRAWASTVQAVKGVALSIGVELFGGLCAAGLWLGAVLLT